MELILCHCKLASGAMMSNFGTKNRGVKFEFSLDLGGTLACKGRSV